jgi:hypothetical protein
MDLATTSWTTTGGWAAPLPGLDSASTLVLVFCDPCLRDDHRAFADLSAAYPTSVVLGCSTSGQIDGASLRDGTATVAVARFERTRVVAAGADVDGPAGSRAAGAALAAALGAGDLRGVLVLSGGLAVNGSELVAGLVGGLDPAVVVTGGLAGDGDRFGHTWVLDRGAVVDGRVVAVGLYGPAVRITAASQGGWQGFGPERTVTRSEGNVLHELDGQPALALYTRYLGDLAADLPASAMLVPLAVRPGPGDEQVVRTVLGVDAGTQTMTFAGDVPTGWRAQLMRSGIDRLVDSAAVAAMLSAKAADTTRPSLSIAVSCVGRRLVLGERTEEEIEAIVDTLPVGGTLVGFYSYGEIAPGATGTVEMHNQTMTVTTVSEA